MQCCQKRQIVHECPKEMDSAIDAGKLILFYEDGEVRVARAVNSFTTKTDEKGDQYKRLSWSILWTPSRVI